MMNVTGEVDDVMCMATILAIPFQSMWCKSVTRSAFFSHLSKCKVEEEEENCEFRLLSDVDSNSEKVSEDMRFWCL